MTLRIYRNHRADLVSRLRSHYTAEAARIEPLSDETLSVLIVRAVAVPGTPTSPRRFGWRLVVVVIASLVAATAALAAGFADDLGVVAWKTGVSEVAPASPAPDYAPAEVPYVSVQSLMQYLGSHDPVVPSAAIVRPLGRNSLFTTDRIVNYHAGSAYAQLAVHIRQVQLGAELGKAVSITSGLSPCDNVVVDPPSSLKDGDYIRSYHVQTAEGPSIDFANLFGGRPPAPQPLIEGGISGGQGDAVRVAIFYRGEAPAGATYYRVKPPAATPVDVPYDTQRSSTEFVLKRSDLQNDQPIAHVQLRNSSGSVLAEGDLAPFCTG